MDTLRGPNPKVLGEPSEASPSAVEIAEMAVVAVALAQGAAVGIWLALFPEAALRAGGFPPAPSIFVRWVGLLHLLLATGYALEWLRFRRVALLVIAKGATAIFLLALGIEDALPNLMYLAMALEAGTACAAAALRGPADRARRSRGRLKLVVSRPSRAAGAQPSRSSQN
jgi:hypothetical protein